MYFGEGGILWRKKIVNLGNDNLYKNVINKIFNKFNNINGLVF